MTDTSLHNRINFLRLLLIIGLVFLHYGKFPDSDLSPFRGFRATETPVATFVNAYLLFLFFSAVPLLSAISGYLFFKDLKPGIAFYSKRFQSRVRSVLLPMISWNGIVLALFLGVSFAMPDSPFRLFVTYDLTTLEPGEILNALLGVTRQPINFQFWFLHDLLLTVLFTPVLVVLLQRIPFAGLIGLGIVWLIGYNFEIFFRTDVLFFFYIGGLVRLRRWNLDFLAPRTAVIIMAAYAVLIGLRTIGPIFVPEQSSLGELLYGPGTRALRIIGVVAFWGCAPLLMRTFLGRQITVFGTLAFFLHAVHWPLNQFIKAGLGAMLPVHGDAMLLVNYFATVALTLAFAFLIARILSASAPRLFSHLSGGRVMPAAMQKTGSLSSSSPFPVQPSEDAAMARQQS